jgi:hypothetical protein
MNEPWAVGLAVYDLPTEDGYLPESVRAVFTTQHLLAAHPLVREIIVVDNNPIPRSPLREYVLKTGIGRYVPMARPQGTSPPRNKVFEVATKERVACIDSHVVLYSGFFESLNDFYDSHPHDQEDLLHGTIVTERGSVYADHMNDQWRCQMWGTWGRAYVTKDGFYFSCKDKGDNRVTYVSLNTNDRQHDVHPDFHRLPRLPWPAHEAFLTKAGCRRPTKPFKIPGHGMGFFACKKDAWLPFHEDCRGFGGEEMTTGYRYRHAGRNCWNVPGARWWHHFERMQIKGQTPTTSNTTRRTGSVPTAWP